MSSRSLTSIASRTSVFGESVIREMTRIANIHGAMNLAQGYPDFPAPDFIKQAGIDAINANINQYAITWGSFRLRKAIADKTKRFYGLDLDPDREITVTCGATEAMMAVMLAVIEPGDEVIVFEPFYENYVPDAAMSGAKLVYVTLRPESGFAIDFDELREAFTSRTRAIIVNTPNNPSGRVFSRTDLNGIASLCQQFDCLCITDEIYEHILYDDHVHLPMATLPGMYDRTVTISGLSKTFSVTGWRLGYVLARPELSNGIRKVHDFLTVGAPAPLQEAAAIAIEQADAFYPDLREMYAHKRGLLLSSLREAGFRAHQPEGAYYIMADFGDIDDARNDVEFALWLTEKMGVAPVPGSSFFRPGSAAGSKIVRFTFSKSEETLVEAGRRLAAM